MKTLILSVIRLIAGKQKYSALFIGAFVFSGQSSSAQYFERTYPGTGMQHVGALDDCIDSGFIICGSNGNNILMKLNPSGDVEWIRQDSGLMSWSSGVIQDLSGNFIVAGSGSEAGFNSVAIINTYDIDGSFISDTSIFPDGWATSAVSITRSPNRYYSHYWYYSDGFTASNYTFLDNGDILGGDMTSVGGNSVSINNSGSYASAGNLLFDLDTTGVWRNNILRLAGTLPGYYYLNTNYTSCALMADGSVMVAGIYDTSGTTCLRLTQISAGNITSDFFIADSTLTSVTEIMETSSGFAVLCSGNSGGNHIVFICIDSSGTLISKNDFYGYGTASPDGFKMLNDGFVILGVTETDPYVIRTDSLGRVSTLSGITGTYTEHSVYVFPNPSGGIFTFELDRSQFSPVKISITDITGKIVYSSEFIETEKTLDLSFLAKGVYHFSLYSDGEKPKSGRLVVN